MVSRRDAIVSAYEKFKSDFLSPKRRKVPICTLPPVSVLRLYEPIKNLLNLPSGTGEFEHQLNPRAEDLINTWPHLTVQELASTCSSLYFPQNVFDIPSLKNLNIFVAASIFLCISCTRARKANSTFFGWAAAVGHENTCYSPHKSPCEDKFPVSVEGYEAALALIGHLGLDPRNTFTHQLNRVKRRFLYMNCEEKSDTDSEKPAFGWRRMVLSPFHSFSDPPYSI